MIAGHFSLGPCQGLRFITKRVEHDATVCNEGSHRHANLLPNQLAMYLRLPDVASRMKGYVSGVAIPRIVLRDFRQFLLLLPPADVQRAWATHCDPMLRLCRNLVRKNENLRTTRDLLLPKLISGELDVSALPEPEALAA